MRVLAALFVASLLVPASVLGQDRQRVPPSSDNSGGSSSGGAPATAVPRESPPPPPPPPPARQAEPARSTPRTSADPGDAGASPAQRRQRVPPENRGDQPRPSPPPRGGTAVPRPPNQPPPPGGGYRGPVYGYRGSYYYPYYYYYPRLYYPYGYGAFGLGYFYYDPYSWGMAYGYPPYPPFRGYGYSYATGELRLDVTPQSAEVYVDGYYAGHVDEFDGVFQSLTLEEGTYHIQVVAPGYAPLEFDVRIFPGRKATYRGELLPVRP